MDNNSADRFFKSSWCPLFGDFAIRFHKSDSRNICQEIIWSCRRHWKVPFRLIPLTNQYPDYEELERVSKKYSQLSPSLSHPVKPYPPHWVVAARCIFEFLFDIKLQLLIVNPRHDWLTVNENYSKPTKELYDIPLDELTGTIRTDYLGRYGYDLLWDQCQTISDSMILSCIAITEAWCAYRD